MKYSLMTVCDRLKLEPGCIPQRLWKEFRAIDAATSYQSYPQVANVMLTSLRNDIPCTILTQAHAGAQTPPLAFEDNGRNSRS